MSTVAEQLRGAREAKNLTIEQIAEITKMRTDHVRAIEEGNYKAFSAPVYIRGFVRTYSRLLKLDERALMTALEAEIGARGEFYEASGRPHTPGLLDFATLQLSKLDWRKALMGTTVAVVLVAAVLGLISWRKARTQDPLKDLKPGIYKPAGESTEMLPLGK